MSDILIQPENSENAHHTVAAIRHSGVAPLSDISNSETMNEPVATPNTTKTSMKRPPSDDEESIRVEEIKKIKLLEQDVAAICDTSKVNSSVNFTASVYNNTTDNSTNSIKTDEPTVPHRESSSQEGNVNSVQPTPSEFNDTQSLLLPHSDSKSNLFNGNISEPKTDSCSEIKDNVPIEDKTSKTNGNNVEHILEKHDSDFKADDDFEYLESTDKTVESIELEDVSDIIDDSVITLERKEGSQGETDQHEEVLLEREESNSDVNKRKKDEISALGECEIETSKLEEILNQNEKEVKETKSEESDSAHKKEESLVDVPVTDLNDKTEIENAQRELQSENSEKTNIEQGDIATGRGNNNEECDTGNATIKDDNISDEPQAKKIRLNDTNSDKIENNDNCDMIKPTNNVNMKEKLTVETNDVPIETELSSPLSERPNSITENVIPSKISESPPTCEPECPYVPINSNETIVVTRNVRNGVDEPDVKEHGKTEISVVNDGQLVPQKEVDKFIEDIDTTEECKISKASNDKTESIGNLENANKVVSGNDKKKTGPAVTNTIISIDLDNDDTSKDITESVVNIDNADKDTTETVVNIHTVNDNTESLVNNTILPIEPDSDDTNKDNTLSLNKSNKNDNIDISDKPQVKKINVIEAENNKVEDNVNCDMIEPSNNDNTKEKLEVETNDVPIESQLSRPPLETPNLILENVIPLKMNESSTLEPEKLLHVPSNSNETIIATGDVRNVVDDPDMKENDIKIEISVKNDGELVSQKEADKLLAEKSDTTKDCKTESLSNDNSKSVEDSHNKSDKSDETKECKSETVIIDVLKNSNIEKNVTEDFNFCDTKKDSNIDIARDSLVQLSKKDLTTQKEEEVMNVAIGDVNSKEIVPLADTTKEVKSEFANDNIENSNLEKDLPLEISETKTVDSDIELIEDSCEEIDNHLENKKSDEIISNANDTKQNGNKETNTVLINGLNVESDANPVEKNQNDTVKNEHVIEQPLSEEKENIHDVDEDMDGGDNLVINDKIEIDSDVELVEDGEKEKRDGKGMGEADKVQNDLVMDIDTTLMDVDDLLVNKEVFSPIVPASEVILSIDLDNGDGSNDKTESVVNLDSADKIESNTDKEKTGSAGSNTIISIELDNDDTSKDITDSGEEVVNLNNVNKDTTESVINIDNADEDKTESLVNLDNVEKDKTESVVNIDNADKDITESVVTNIDNVDKDITEPVVNIDKADKDITESVVNIDNADKDITESLVNIDNADKDITESVVTNIDNADKDTTESVVNIDNADKDITEPVVNIDNADKDTTESVTNIDNAEKDKTESGVNIDAVKDKTILPIELDSDDANKDNTEVSVNKSIEDDDEIIFIKECKKESDCTCVMCDGKKKNTNKQDKVEKVGGDDGKKKAMKINEKLDNLTKKGLEKLVNNLFVKYFAYESESGKLRELLGKLQSENATIKSVCQAQAKQLKELTHLHEKALTEIATFKSENNGGVPPIPVKITRSVGLQVKVSPPNEKKRPAAASPITPRQAQKRKRGSPVPPSRVGVIPLPRSLPSSPLASTPPKATVQTAQFRPSTAAARKSTGGMSPRFVPRAGRPTTSSLVGSAGGLRILPPRAVNSNAASAVRPGLSPRGAPVGRVITRPPAGVVPRSPTQVKPAASSSVETINLDEDETPRPTPQPQTVKVIRPGSGTHSMTVRSTSVPIRLATTTTGSGVKAAGQTTSSPSRLYVPLSQGIKLRPATGSTGNILTSVANTSSATTYILETSAGPIPFQTNSNVRLNLKPNATANAGVRLNYHGHPAPVPPTPPATAVPLEARYKLVPAAPKLRVQLADAGKGIQLTWSLDSTTDMAAIESYQLYAYQENKAVAITSNLWRNIGKLEALPLPMACTLTQFTAGHTYHFLVRAIDVFKRYSAFSNPGTIHLRN
ncbi:hypothetical protein WDU94_003476 [Cyamophila willieti]